MSIATRHWILRRGVVVQRSRPAGVLAWVSPNSLPRLLIAMANAVDASIRVEKSSAGLARLAPPARNPALDIAAFALQKQWLVILYPSSDYARWRLRSGGVCALRDGESAPPEKLLQAVWQHQRLLRQRLRTLDGRPLRILHPGFLSREGGPDFRGAVVQFGDEPPRAGDVEVDRHVNGWHAHGHDRNPAFRGVVLHVIWKGEQTASTPPGLALVDCLDSPVADLSRWLNSDAAELLPAEARGRCCAPLRAFSQERLAELLQWAAQIRFRGKAAQFSARARQAGWEQALWEGLFRALGYKHNPWPMQALAELLPRWRTRCGSAVECQARLLGIGNLLPAQLTGARADADAYVRRIWDQWWRERDEFGDCQLPRSLWRFHGLRPANDPQRRLALAAHWLADGGLAGKLERWCALPLAEEHLGSSLQTALQISSDEFWSWHWTLRGVRLTRPQPLLGAARVTDLAVNVILPWLWSRAMEGKNPRLQEEIEHRFGSWPAGEDNAVLRMARRRLLGEDGRRRPMRAAQQQGLLQIVRDFCDHSNAVCAQCQFPELARGFGSE